MILSILIEFFLVFAGISGEDFSKLRETYLNGALPVPLCSPGTVGTVGTKSALFRNYYNLLIISYLF